MGIRGFESFLRDYPVPILQRVKFRDQYLVIDGSELLYELYFESDGIGRGNYASFREHIENFFECLRDCRIRPVVIFDGFKYGENEGRYLKRREDKIESMAGFFTSGKCAWIKPSLCALSFKQALEDLKVPWAVGIGDTDQDMAAIANILDAPVLATDTVFCAFSLKHGHFPYRLFNWNKARKSGQDFIQAEVFRAQDFATKFHIDEGCIPFLAVLFSNVVSFEFETFERFRTVNIKTMRLPPELQRLRGRSFRRPNWIENCLVWLSENYLGDDDMIDRIISTMPQGGDVQEMPGKILDFLNNCRRPRAQREVIEKIRDAFVEPEIRYLLDEDDLCYPRDPLLDDEDMQEAVQMSLTQQFPSWAMQFLLQKLADKPLIKYVPLVFTNPAEFDSPNTVSEPLRLISYQALLLDDRDSINVVEFLRQGMTYRENQEHYIERPLETLGPAGRAFVSTEEEAYLEQRKRYFLRAVLEPFDDAAVEEYKQLTEVLPADMQVTIAATVFWIKAENPDEAAVKALALQLVVLRQENPKISLQSVMRSLESRLPRRKLHQRVPDEQALHWSTQWQCCMRDAIGLNQVLHLPFCRPKIAQTFEGCLFEVACSCCLAGIDLLNFLELSDDSRYLYEICYAALNWR